jgi:hypothetical protein
MHSDDFIRCFKYDIENDLESHFDELFNRCTADDSEYCVVDGEEGDFGIIRYMPYTRSSTRGWVRIFAAFPSGKGYNASHGMKPYSGSMN